MPLARTADSAVRTIKAHRHVQAKVSNGSATVSRNAHHTSVNYDCLSMRRMPIPELLTSYHLVSTRITRGGDRSESSGMICAVLEPYCLEERTGVQDVSYTRFAAPGNRTMRRKMQHRDRLCTYVSIAESKQWCRATSLSALRSTCSSHTPN
jgi:hypothetical protein